jgi:hypothetical protein
MDDFDLRAWCVAGGLRVNLEALTPKFDECL